MAMTAADLPSANMPAEEPQSGDQTRMAAARKAVESAGSPGGARQPQPGAPPQAAPQPTGGMPVQPAPSQPGIPLQQGRPIDQRVDMGNLFQQAPQLREPWRTWLRRQASRPGAGPEMQALSDAIEHQRGPLEARPQRTT